ncbi:hypothetical protein GJ496_006228 [Pomphorhynchus laevis]|nr:hypothetical protein GJ496_006228 [Pomphorhynchus laevis]
MCERLTQAQMQVQNYAEQICNAIGLIQQNAQPSQFEDVESDSSVKPRDDTFTDNFGKLIVKMISDVSTLIDTIPPNVPKEDQRKRMKKIQQLEASNTDKARILEEMLNKCKSVRTQVRNRLEMINTIVLEMDERISDRPAELSIEKSSAESSKEDSSLNFGESLELSDHN